MSIPPFRLRFENNDSFEHRERRWIGRGIGASRFVQSPVSRQKWRRMNKIRRDQGVRPEGTY